MDLILSKIHEKYGIYFIKLYMQYNQHVFSVSCYKIGLILMARLILCKYLLFIR